MPFSVRDSPEAPSALRVGAPRCSRFALAFIATLVAACAFAVGAPGASAGIDYALTVNGTSQHGSSTAATFASRTTFTIEA